MIRRRTLLAAPALILPATARAQGWPARPISMIVAFGAGGGTDVAARSIARFMERNLGGASIGVVNRPGAGGEVGWTALAQAAPDGYTIGFINVPAIVALTVEKQTRFTMDSFAPIGNIAYDPAILCVRSDSPYKSLGDFVAAAKAEPGRITVGSSGAPGNSEHLALLVMQRLTGTRINHAPFGGTAPLRTALLGGHVPAATFNLSEGVDQAAEGNLRILGVMSVGREALAPDVPTFREQGVDVVAGSSRGLVAPKGVDAAILARLQEALAKAIDDPEYKEAAIKAKVPLRYMAAEEYGAFLNRTLEEIRAIWAATPWR